MRKTLRALACAATALSATGLAITGLAAGSAGAATSASAAPASAAAVQPGPWAQANYNAADSNANLGETALTPSTIGSAHYLRSVYAPPPLVDDCNPGGFTLAPPLLDGGYVYVVANYTLSKYQASNGSLVWSAALDADASDAPVSIAVSGDNVVVGGSDCGSVSDPSGSLASFSASTGQAQWHTTIGQFDGPLNTLGVASGLVITSGHSSGGGIVVGAFQASNGQQAWLNSDDLCGGGPAVVVGGNVVYVTCDANDPSGTELKAVSLTTGQQVWADAGEWHVMAGDRSTSAGMHVFASEGGTVYDVNPATGAKVYSLSGAAKVLAVGPSDVYASTSTGLTAYHLSNGSQAWSAGGFGQVAVATEAGGVLYTAGGSALNATTGAQVTQLWSGTATSIVVGEGRVAAVVDPRAVDLYGLAGS